MGHMRVSKVRSVRLLLAGIFVVAYGFLCPAAMTQVHYGYAQPPSGSSSATPAKQSATVTQWSDPSGRTPSTRRVEKHTQTDGKEVTTRSSGSSAGGGGYQAPSDTEEVRQRVDSNTVRVVRRQFAT